VTHIGVLLSKTMSPLCTVGVLAWVLLVRGDPIQATTARTTARTGIETLGQLGHERCEDTKACTLACSFCEAASGCSCNPIARAPNPTKVTPVQVTMSSQDRVHTPAKCVDGLVTNFCQTAHANDPFPFIALKLSNNNARVTVVRVVLINRIASTANAARLRDVEVRVSNQLPLNGLSRFQEGSVLGTFRGPGKSGEIIEFSGSIAGKYVVIQQKTKRWFHLADILIYSS